MTKEQIRRELEKTITAKYITEESTDTQYCISLRNGVCEIDFQGSVSAKDWAQNFNFLKRFTNKKKIKYMVHGGFLQKWNAIQPIILKFLNQNINQIQVLTFRGHSQGGALATLAHGIIYELGYVFTMRSIVFGSPRVWSWWADKTIFHNLVRVETFRDIVCKVPFSFLGFKHVGKKIVINRGPWYMGLVPSIKAHSPKQYFKAVL